MTAARDRKEAAKRLGIVLQAQYRALLSANNNEEIQEAAIVLGSTFNDNVEAIVWFLKAYGGVQQPPLERLHKRQTPKPANDLPATPAIFLNGKPN